MPKKPKPAAASSRYYAVTDIDPHSSSIDTQDSDGRGQRRAAHIDHRQVRNIIRAVLFADRQGQALNYFVTLNFGHTACGVEDVSKIFERLRDNHYTKWLRDAAHRKNQPSWLPALYIWSIENKPNNPNVHWLIHILSPLRPLFEKKLHTWLAKLAGPLDYSQTPIHIRHAPTPMSAAKYLSKAIDPRHAKLFKIRPVPQGIVVGKRAGISAALGPAAIARATLNSSDHLRPALLTPTSGHPRR